MASQTPGLATLGIRLEKLERDNRRLRLTAIILVLLVVAALLMGQAPPTSRTVEGQEFVVTDKAGRERAVLGVASDTAHLLFRDDERQMRVNILVSSDGVSLTFFDVGLMSRAGLSLVSDGSAVFHLNDKDGIRRAILELAADGSPTFSLRHKDGKVLFKAP